MTNVKIKYTAFSGYILHSKPGSNLKVLCYKIHLLERVKVHGSYFNYSSKGFDSSDLNVIL